VLAARSFELLPTTLPGGGKPNKIQSSQIQSQIQTRIERIMQRIIHISIILAIMLLIAGCGEKKETVAKAGNEIITVEQFKDAFMQKHRTEENVLRMTFNDRKDFVKGMAVNLAKYQEGLARGYDKDPQTTSQLDEIAKRLSLDYLYQAKVTDAVITEDMMRHYYDQSAQEYRARHILLKLQPQDTTAAAEAPVRARIDSIKTLIDKGMNFGEAVVKFSEDGTTAPDSGDLEWFPWGRMVGEFQDAVWKAKIGEMVGPVRTPYGYHLIQVTDIRDVGSRPSFEDMKEQLKNQMRNSEGEKMGQVAREFVENLRASNDLKYNEEALTMLVERLKDPNLSKTQELGPLFTAEQKAMTAATYRGGEIKISDLIDKIGVNASRVDWNDKQVIYDLTNSLLEPKLLEAVAEKEGFLKKAKSDPEYVDQLRTTVIRQLEKAEVTDKTNPTEAEEKAYYESHLESYIMPEQRVIREIFIKEDSVKAVRVRDRALKGENFAQLALRFNEKESTDTGRIGPMEQKRFGLLGKTAFRLDKVGDISEVVKVGTNFSVVQVLDILPSRTQTWEESKAQAKREYQQVAAARLQEDLEKSVLEKFPLTIYEDKLAAVWPLKQEEKLTREP
jgi:parvulin-like peptidyl-prolyl isomerase